DEAVLSRVVEVDCDRLGVVDVVVLEDAPDFLRARLHAVDVDHVVDSPEMPIVAIAQTFHLVSVSPKSFSVWSCRDAVVVLFIVVSVFQLRTSFGTTPSIVTPVRATNSPNGRAVVAPTYKAIVAPLTKLAYVSQGPIIHPKLVGQASTSLGRMS